MRIPELLAPVGSPDKLLPALDYGADAVYLSSQQFGLRASAGNFDIDDLRKAAEIVKAGNKNIYLTLNAFCRNKSFPALREFLNSISDIPIDAFIISDPGVFLTSREVCPHIPVHISTQANTINMESVRFWENQGVKRVILARELSAEEVAEIAKSSSCEIEIFVHGALCLAYAGKCYLSAYLESRESNAGQCSQLCRRTYQLLETQGADRVLSVEMDDENAYFLNTRDLCLIEKLPQIAEMGITSIKIEGRMKSAYYVAAVTRVYRDALNTLKQEGIISEEKLRGYTDELHKVSNRGFTTGYFGLDIPQNMIKIEGKYIQQYVFMGIIKNPVNGTFRLDPRNKIRRGDHIEIIGPNRANDRITTVTKIIRDNTEQTDANPNQISEITVDIPVCHGEIMRINEEDYNK
ncbi:MAG: U32 family peptidase [Candidatus Auribacterota bacterium]